MWWSRAKMFRFLVELRSYSSLPAAAASAFASRRRHLAQPLGRHLVDWKTNADWTIRLLSNSDSSSSLQQPRQLSRRSPSLDDLDAIACAETKVDNKFSPIPFTSCSELIVALPATRTKRRGRTRRRTRTR